MKTDSTDNHDESAAERIENDQWTILGDESTDAKITKDELIDPKFTKDELIDAKTTKLSLETTCDSQLVCKTLSEPKANILTQLLPCFMGFMGLAFFFMVIHHLQVEKISSLENRIKHLESEKLAVTVDAKRLVELPQAEQHHFQSQKRVVENGLVEQNAEWTGAAEIPEHIPKQLIRENNYNDDSDNSAQQIETQRKNYIDKNDEEARPEERLMKLEKEDEKNTEPVRKELSPYITIYFWAFIIFGSFFTLQIFMKVVKKNDDIAVGNNADTDNADIDNADTDNAGTDNAGTFNGGTDDANTVNDDAIDYELIMTMLQNAQKLIECRRETFKNTNSDVQ